MASQPVERRFITPAGPLCWFEWGAASSRPSLLLLHATGFHARLWDAVVADLPDGTHVVAPDLPGHGRSYRPQTMGDWSATADALAGFVEAVVPAGAVGVGHSMGGYCVTKLAAALPACFARLVLVDPVIMAPDIYMAAADRTPPDPAGHPVARRRNSWTSSDEMLARFNDRLPYARWHPDVLADYCRWGLVSAASGEGLELACPPLLEASVYFGSAGGDAHACLDAIDCPVLVVRGRRAERGSAMDFSSSPTWPNLAAQFADARDLSWDDCSHFIPMEMPGRLATLIASELSATEQG